MLKVFVVSFLGSSIVDERMNFGRVGGWILYAILSSYVLENSAEKVLAGRLKGRVHSLVQENAALP